MGRNPYEAIDRDMSSWTLACTHNGVRFFLSEDAAYTDLLSRARRFRWRDEAEAVALEHSEPGFRLEPMSVPAAMTEAA